MTQSETQERVAQIRDRRNALQLRHGDWPCQTVHNGRERAFQQYVLADIDFLLSLIDTRATVDSQAYEVNEVDAERLADYNKIGSMPAIIKSVDYGAVTLAECVEMAIDRWYKRGQSDAATQMRTACVEKVRAMRERWLGRLPNSDDSTFKYHYQTRADAASEVITALSSLTLDQVKQKEQSK